MRQLSRRLERDGSGVVALVPDESEDMWHAYNLIAIGDQVRASTVRFAVPRAPRCRPARGGVADWQEWGLHRRVQTESSTGTIDSARVRVTLTIAVTAIDFDTGAATLRLNGRTVEESRYRASPPCAQRRTGAYTQRARVGGG
jgi:protein pelota